MAGRGFKSVTLYTPEIWEQVNKNNKRLLKDFLAYKKTSGKSEKTIGEYEKLIRFFFCWNYLENDNKDFTEIKKREFVRFFATGMEEYKWSPNRVALYRASLSSMSIYIENILDDEYPNFRNNVLKVEIPVKETVREKTVLSEADVQKILDGLVAEKLYQQACYFALAAYSGARKAELLSYKVSYISDENIVFGSLYKTPEKIRTKGRGKTGKLLYKYVIAKPFKPYFDMWMQKRKELGIESEWLFIKSYLDGQTPEQADEDAVDRWAGSATRILGDGRVVYSHSFRHFFATSLKEKGLPDNIVVAIIGWEEASGGAMLSIYNDREVTEDFGKYFDENGIKPQGDTPTIKDVFG